MKVQELFEMPELRDWEIDPVKAGWVDDKPTYNSFSTFERQYDDLQNSSLYIDGEKAIIGLAKKHVSCVAYIKTFKPNSNEQTLQVITRIQFYYPRPLSNHLPSDIINPLQVQKVYTIEPYKGDGIASFLYALLAKEGFTIISDKVQYLGGKELWKHMAREAKLNDYTIHIWNEISGYVKDEATGSIIEYDSKNIDDAIIWKKTGIGQKTLLILKSK
jgi:hypothetical protein